MPIDLRFDQDQVDEDNHKIMLDIFVAELPAVLAYCQAHAVAAGIFVGALIFGVECFDWKSALYTDWHLIEQMIFGGTKMETRYSIPKTCRERGGFGKTRWAWHYEVRPERWLIFLTFLYFNLLTFRERQHQCSKVPTPGHNHCRVHHHARSHFNALTASSSPS